MEKAIHRLKEIRKELNLTQSDLAEMCGTSLVMYQYVENGQRQFSEKWIRKISTALKLEPWMLFINPQTMLNSGDNELISRYHSLDDNLKKAVDAILLGSNKT